MKATAIFFTARSAGPRLGDCVHEGAAAEVFRRKAPLQRIERRKNLLGRRLVGGARAHEAALQIGGDQRVLGREMVIERALADADLGRDGVDADGANALQIEQLVGGLQNPLFHRLWGRRGSHAAETVLFA